MSERSLRGFIVDDEEYKTNAITRAFEKCGGVVVARAVSAVDVQKQLDEGAISVTGIDVVFLDSNLGHGFHGGATVNGLLFRRGLNRTPFGDNPLDDPVIPSSKKWVVVGTSTDVDSARELGSYSDVLREPLMLEWEPIGWGARELDLSIVLREAARLKPLATE